MSSPWFASLLPLLVLLGTAFPSQACRRRLENIFPEGQARNPVEEKLLGITRDLESCLELGEGTPKQRDERLARALDHWEEFYRENPQNPPTPELDTPHYALILRSIDGYMRRIRELSQARHWQDCRIQSVAVQHVFGELYGVLPGRAEPLDVVLYTLSTLVHLPPPATPTANQEEWEGRLQTLEDRLEAWVRGAPPILQRLTTLASIREALGALRHALRERDPGAGAQTLRRLQALVPRLPGDAARVAWTPEDSQDLLIPEPAP